MDVVTTMLTALAGAMPFVIGGLIAWGKVSAKVDQLIGAMTDLNATIRAIDVKQDDHAERIARLEARFSERTGRMHQ